MPNLEHYNEDELRMIAEMLGLRMRSVLMQKGSTPQEANLFLAECIACALKVAHAEADKSLLRGPVRRFAVVA